MANEHAPAYENLMEMQFDALARKALTNERKNYIRDVASQTNFEIAEELKPEIVDTTAAEAFDEIDSAINVGEFGVVIKGDLLYDAVAELEKRKRDVLLLKAYSRNAPDSEIGEMLDIGTRMVNYLRHSAEREVRQKLGGMENEHTE